MKRFRQCYVVIVLTLAVVLVSVPALAAVSIDKSMSASLGMFYISDSSASDILGTGTAFTFEKTFMAKGPYDLSASVGYVTFSNTYEGVDVKETLIPLMITARSNGTVSQKAYFGLGAGLMLMNVDLGSGSSTRSQTDLGLQLLGGYKFTPSIFGELKLIGGGRAGNTGYSLNIGAKF